MSSKNNKTPIHPSIKERLGYDPTTPDKDFLRDWKKCSTKVCKPCWELKYCPYGPLVEQSPLLPTLRQKSDEHIQYIKNCLKSGQIGYAGPLQQHERERYESTLIMYKRRPELIFQILGKHFMKIEWIDEELSKGRSFKELFGHNSEHTPLQNVSAPFPFDEDENEIEIPAHIIKLVKTEIKRMQTALKTGKMDNRKPLDSARRREFEREVQDYNPESLPLEIPESVAEMRCNIFGHICPIVFTAENITETSSKRLRGRHISFKTKMRVVRRDNHTCQHCGAHLRDDEVEFDHIIPVAKGGSCEEHNIRLTCYKCNREKSDNVDI